jgi:hypothetical protein
MTSPQTTDRLDVQDTLTRMSWFLDRRDWDSLAGVFGDRVLVDYTQPFGGKAENLSGDQLSQRWREQVGRLDATHHVVTGMLVELDGDRARVTANVLASLRREGTLGASLWQNGGIYDVGMTRHPAGWRIVSLTAQILWGNGNAGILQSPPVP